jgi:putative endonuclease
MSNNFGRKAEEYALQLLKSRGYIILEKNYYTKVGEIDIIAIDGDTLVFVEVKARKTTRFGRPEEAVGERKIHKITQAGEYYRFLNKNTLKKLRIDVVSLVVENGVLVDQKIISVV